MTAGSVPTVVDVNDGHIELLTSDGWREYLERDVLPWILSTIPAPDLAEVVEVGPGPGLVTELLRPRVGTHVAIEIDDGLATSLRARFEPDSVEVICADATATDLEGGRFTAALCLTMLHHVPAPPTRWPPRGAGLSRQSRAPGVPFRRHLRPGRPRDARSAPPGCGVRGPGHRAVGPTASSGCEGSARGAEATGTDLTPVT
jgi:hypothetical protein